MPGGHPDKEVNEAVGRLREAGWSVESRSGHPWGCAKCPHGCCIAWIWSTPRNPGAHARKLERAIERCPGEEVGRDA